MKTLTPALLLVTCLCACSPAQTAQPAPVTYDARHRISVTGEALINVAPDRIIVTLGADTRDLNLLVAKQENDAIVKSTLGAMKALKIAERDIQTDQLSIEQRFENGPRGGQVFAGYTVRNMLVVTLNDPARVETVISKALDAGINYLLGVEFQTSELKKFREQARELAVKAAREKADKMAATLGAAVGSAIQIDEAAQNFGPAYYSSWSTAAWGNARSGSPQSQNSTVQVSAGETTDTIALGRVGVRASVSVTFELR